MMRCPSLSLLFLHLLKEHFIEWTKEENKFEVKNQTLLMDNVAAELINLIQFLKGKKLI